MDLKWKLFLLVVCAINVYKCETEVNSTVTSRREVLEQQTRKAYQNACFRLQELSNWMTVVFRIKSVWASATVNELAAKSGDVLNKADGRIPSLLPRAKLNSECSLRTMQVTAQTYAYLQSQMLLLKMIMGRNIIKSSREKLGNANLSIRERMNQLEVFNTTLTDIISKLKQNTEEGSARVNSESWSAWRIIKDIQDGRFLQYLQDPKAFFQRASEENLSLDSEQSGGEAKNFFQNLGKILDRTLFSRDSLKVNSSVENAVLNFTDKIE